MIKKIVIALAAIVVLLIAAAVIIPFFIPVETVKQELQAQVKEATGRDLAIDGDFEFSLLPNAVLKAGNVRFQNAAAGSRADMVTLEELRVHVALLPLLSSDVQVKEFVLERPDILLEVDKDGNANWAFQTGGAAAAGGSDAAGSGGGGGGGLQSISLGDVRIVDGRLEYRDARTGTAEVIENMNLTLNLPSLDQPFSAEGEATWHQEALGLALGAESPRALLGGGTTNVSVSLNGKPLALSYAGNLNAGAGSAAGELELDVPSVRGLAAWTGNPLEVKGEEVLNRLKLNGQVSASADQVAMSGVALTLDKIDTTGDLSVALGGAVPSVKGSLSVPALDLNPYLEAFGGSEGAAAGAPSDSGRKGWSEEPIDLSALRSVDADLTLSVGSLRAQEIKIGKSKVKAVLQGGKLDLNLSEMALYDGNGQLRLNVDASGQKPTVESRFALSGLQAEPFLTDAAELDWLSGTAVMEMSVTTQGNSQKALANALNGSGKMAFTDGAVRGTNLAALLRGISTLKLNPTAWETEKTDFAELSGTFTIADGILKNDDLTLQSQLMRVGGAGTVGIGPRNIDYTAEPKAVASLQGQGGAADIGGLPIKVHVHGSWDDPQTDYSLGGNNLLDLAKDPKALVSSLSNLGAIKDPKALAEQLGGLGGMDSGVLDALKGLRGGSGGSPTDALKSVLPGSGSSGSGSSGSGSPADSLKKLIPGGSSSTDGNSGASPEPETTEPNPRDSLKNLFNR